MQTKEQRTAQLDNMLLTEAILLLANLDKYDRGDSTYNLVNKVLSQRNRLSAIVDERCDINRTAVTQ